MGHHINQGDFAVKGLGKVGFSRNIQCQNPVPSEKGAYYRGEGLGTGGNIVQRICNGRLLVFEISITRTSGQDNLPFVKNSEGNAYIAPSACKFARSQVSIPKVVPPAAPGFEYHRQH